MKRKRKRKFRTEAQKKREARNKTSQALEKTKRKLGIRPSEGRLKGAVRSPLVTEGWVRKPKAAPTSDRIPGATPVKDLIHSHRWKRGAEEFAFYRGRDTSQGNADRTGLQQGRTPISPVGGRDLKQAAKSRLKACPRLHCKEPNLSAKSWPANSNILTGTARAPFRYPCSQPMSSTAGAGWIGPVSLSPEQEWLVPGRPAVTCRPRQLFLL